MEKIKIGLLGVIAVTLVINTFFKDDAPTRYATADNAVQTSNIAATPVSNNANALNPLATPNPVKPAQNTPLPGEASRNRAKTGMKFAELKHDFGSINQDSENTKVFKFTNTGNEPLIIENAVGSCGCTVPKYPKEPIKPGDTGEIEVVYKPGKQQGSQNKTVTITANTDPVSTVLNISAEVQTAE